MKRLKINRPKSPSIRKNPPKQNREEEELDKAFHKQTEIMFEEWNSEEDEAAFRDL